MMKITKQKEKGPSQSTHTIKKLASKYEKYSHQNNMFNGKNLSDNSKVSRFYNIKAKPEEQFREQVISNQSRRQQTATNLHDELPIFTNNMINHLYDDN